MALVPAWNKINVNGTELYCSSCGVPAEILAAVGLSARDPDAPAYASTLKYIWASAAWENIDWESGLPAYNVMTSNNIALPIARYIPSKGAGDFPDYGTYNPFQFRNDSQGVDGLSSANFTIYVYTALSQGTTRPTATFADMNNYTITCDMSSTWDVQYYQKFTLPTIIPSTLRVYNSTTGIGITGYRYTLTYYTIDFINDEDSSGESFNAIQATSHTVNFGGTITTSGTYTEQSGYMALKLNSYTTE